MAATWKACMGAIKPAYAFRIAAKLFRYDLIVECQRIGSKPPSDRAALRHLEDADAAEMLGVGPEAVDFERVPFFEAAPAPARTPGAVTAAALLPARVRIMQIIAFALITGVLVFLGFACLPEPPG
jgi:hypothetical protein